MLLAAVVHLYRREVAYLKVTSHCSLHVSILSGCVSKRVQESVVVDCYAMCSLAAT